MEHKYEEDTICFSVWFIGRVETGVSDPDLAGWLLSPFLQRGADRLGASAFQDAPLWKSQGHAR